MHVFSIDARVANFEFNFGAFLYQTKETGPLRVKSNKETGPLALRIVRAFSIKLGLAIVAKNKNSLFSERITRQGSYQGSCNTRFRANIALGVGMEIRQVMTSFFLFIQCINSICSTLCRNRSNLLMYRATPE